MPVIIQYTNKAEKGRGALSKNERAILEALEQDMRETGGKPLGRGWSSLGPLRQYAGNAYHCHLTRNKVAVWLIDQETTKQGRERVKVTFCLFEYVGSRDKAPY